MSSATTTPRLTLAVGGLGIMVAGGITLLGRTVSQLPALPQITFVWHPGHDVVAAAVLFGAAIVLAFGVRTEQGIVGRSSVGRVGLVLFGVTSLVAAILSSLPLPTLDTVSDWTATYVAVAEVTQVVMVVALLATAAEVIRAGLITGMARWSLLVLASWMAAELLFARVPYAGWVIAVAGSYLQLALEIATGVLFVLQGQASSPSSLPVSGAVEEINGVR